jgi:hypothetical protein
LLAGEFSFCRPAAKALEVSVTSQPEMCVGQELAAIHKILTDAVIAALQEIRDLPNVGMDPDWEPDQEG